MTGGVLEKGLAERPSSEGLAPGQLVRVRSRQYLIEEIIPPEDAVGDTRVRLACVEDDAQGDKLEVFWERELDAQPIGAATWDTVVSQGFDNPRYFSAYFHTLRWNCVTSTDPRLFQAPYRAGIEVKAYQLEPLRKALRMPRVNLFIADDVGLGKTIEAGLILREMLLRQRIERVVISCPPSVVQQWQEEMVSRFGLTFAIYDRAFVAARRRERGYGINPWKTHNRFIISHALLRDETYKAPLRDWLGEFSAGSMFILDEAHNAAPASSSKYAVDSQLTRTVRELAPRFEHRLFLSATPHNGHSNSFAALLEILDPQRFCRGVPVRSKADLDAVMVRRLKQDLREIKNADFPERRVIPVKIENLPSDAPELALSRLLQEYRDCREARLNDANNSTRAAAMLVILSLQKRLLSSIEAFSRTLRVHRQAIERQAQAQSIAPPVAQGNLSLLAEAPGNDDDRAELDERDVELEADAQMTAATQSIGGVTERELQLLEEM
ncbi:MAG: DISARM system SNF2-like helicase DrmD, partial [Cyanobacteria bacterium J06641_5]